MRKRFRLPVTPDEGIADEIRSELEQLPGVGEVHVAPGEQDVAVEADEDVVAADELLAAIGRAGVDARLAWAGAATPLDAVRARCRVTV